MAYPKEIREKCGEIFAARRSRSAEELAVRRAKVMAAIPELARLERELATTSIRLSRAVLEGVDVEKKVEEIKQFNLSKQAEIKAALINAGFSADELELRFCCPICKRRYQESNMLSTGESASPFMATTTAMALLLLCFFIPISSPWVPT